MMVCFRTLSLLSYYLELCLTKWFGRVVKTPAVNRICESLEKLEDHLTVKSSF